MSKLAIDLLTLVWSLARLVFLLLATYWACRWVFRGSVIRKAQSEAWLKGLQAGFLSQRDRNRAIYNPYKKASK